MVTGKIINQAVAEIFAVHTNMLLQFMTSKCVNLGSYNVLIKDMACCL